MYFVQIVNDGTPGALYEADGFNEAKELLRKVLVKGDNPNGPVELTPEVEELIEDDGYYESAGFGVYIVSSEQFVE